GRNGPVPADWLGKVFQGYRENGGKSPCGREAAPGSARGRPGVLATGPPAADEDEGREKSDPEHDRGGEDEAGRLPQRHGADLHTPIAERGEGPAVGRVAGLAAARERLDLLAGGEVVQAHQVVPGL